MTKQEKDSNTDEQKCSNLSEGNIIFSFANARRIQESNERAKLVGEILKLIRKE